MRTRAVAFMAVTFSALIGFTAVTAQKVEPGTASPRLAQDATCVRILLGVGDRTRQDWSGKAAIDRGEILGLEGYRFRGEDALLEGHSWRSRSQTLRKATVKKAAVASEKKQSGPGNAGALLAPTGVLVTARAPNDAKLSVTTSQGDAVIPLSDLIKGEPIAYLDGKIIAQRVPPTAPLADGPDQEDFPSAASDGDSGAWVVYVKHEAVGANASTAYTERPKSFAELKPKGGGDQILLARVQDGQVKSTHEVTGRGKDVWRPAVAVDGGGKVVVVWSENLAGNFDLFSRSFDPKSSAWAEPVRLTRDPGADADVALAVRSDGQVWAAWQAWRGGRARILVAPVAAGQGEPVAVSPDAANAWSPSLAADAKGGLAVAFDSYEQGNYDVIMRRLSADGSLGKAITVAGTSQYEARPSIALDSRGRVWIAYEERTDNWGKDAENLVTGEGSSLYRTSAVRVKCVEGDRILEAPNPVADAPKPLQGMNSYPKLTCDKRGRVWLVFRHRQEAVWGNNAVMVAGGVWISHVTSLEGKSWEPPQPLTASDGLLDNRPALVSNGGDRPLLVFYNSDGRLRREVEFTPELAWKHYSHSGTPPGVINNDIFMASVSPRSGGAVDPAVMEASTPPISGPPAVHPDEAADVARMRNYRVKAGAKTYQFLRGDFHRHTEVSQDGGSDGSLEDMWRYAIDAAAFDWMGNADHDNGGGKEYTWWLVQKTTDLYHGPRLTTLFTYERSVSYPHGHRNVMFAERGIRTLPRLVENRQVVDADTLMLYDYLKEFNGVCASHTSGTGMGTDWRDLNPRFESMVEIFQGHRNSYEHFGAPRVARRPNEAIGGWKPLGMIWNALAMQYKVGFQASSDHISTHISYAIAVAENPTRQGVIDAFRRRHCYGATDNILLDVRSGDHLMGDEFNAPKDGRLTLHVKAHGTRPIARVDVIKDFRYVFSTEPKQAEVSFDWTDEENRPNGLSWYYARVIQDDGELAWSSPMWVHFAGSE